MTKWLSLLMAVILLVGMASFATAEEQPVINNQEVYDLYLAAEDNNMPICKPGEITLTIYVELDEYAANFMQSYEEHPIVKKVEEITGLKLKFIHPPTGDDGTFFNMTIASGDYPDIFIGRFSGPLRATVPLVAGIVEMPYWHFQFANFSSAFLWAAVLMAPGVFGARMLM